MKYFLDTEFLEGVQTHGGPFFLKGRLRNYFMVPKPTIDLISIGIVAEDGREYYAISKDFNLDEAWNRYDLGHDLASQPHKIYWIRENVLRPIFWELLQKDEPILCHVEYEYCFSYKRFKELIRKYGKTNTQIAEEIKGFLGGEDYSFIRRDTIKAVYNDKPEFYAYYADYDWVAFCWLFGKMMDLPNGFPMYCRDLKQMVDDTCEKITNKARKNHVDCPAVTHESMKKNNPNYPKQENEHSAIDDARWNKKLYDFLCQI